MSGQQQVYVDRFPNLGERQQVSINGGRVPLWSPHNQELIYRSPDGCQVLAVAIATGATLDVDSPEVLFEGRYLAPLGSRRPYDLTPDGQRFAVIKDGDYERNVEIALVLNWTEELKRLVPTND